MQGLVLIVWYNIDTKIQSMRRVSLYRIFFLLCGAVVILFPVSVQGESSSIIIQEVQIAGDSTDDEFIELYNSSDTSIDISNWQLRRKTESGSVSSIKVFAKDTLVPPYSYYLWANSKGAFSNIADATTSSSALANNNSIALYTKSGADGLLIDSLSWGKGGLFRETDLPQITPLKNESLIRDTPGSWIIRKPSNPENSHSNPSPPTPILIPDPNPEPPQVLPAPSPAPNPLPPVIVVPTPAPLPASPVVIPLNTTVSINEILPNPLPPDEEFVELSNQGNEPVDMAGWTLHDASKNGQYTFPQRSILHKKDFMVIRKSLFRFALNNSNETLILRDSQERVVYTLHYPRSIAGVSLNQASPNFRGGTPTPGQANLLNELPITRERVPASGFPDIALTFNARGKDSEDTHLKYVWDFGDGHKSYKEKTTHKYQETGSYTLTLTTKDSKDSLTETFTVTIKKYTPPKLRIVAFSANPEGADTGKEWLDIENRSKREVDLKGFSLATGTKSKKLTNHPIRESVTLEAGETLRLTREHSLFSLPNTKGYLELRAPNGDTVDRFHYKQEKTLAENALYQKERGGSWTLIADAEVSVLGVTDDNSEEGTLQPEISAPETELSAPPVHTEEEKQTLYSKLQLLVHAPEFTQYQITTAQITPSEEVFFDLPKKKDSFESLREKLNASLVAILW